MTKRFLTSLLILPALLATASTSSAQYSGGEYCPTGGPGGGYGASGYALQSGPKHPQFPPFGCGGFCMSFLSRLHFHGPLYNYGPYTGYYPFEPYGPWTSDLRYNGPRPGDGSCGWKNGGNGLGWGHYAVGTLKNVFHRVNPCANKCGSCLSLGSCGKHGSQCSTATCGTAEPACAAAATCVPTATGHTDMAGVPVSTEVIAQPVQPAPVEVKAPALPVPTVPTVPTVLTGQKK